MLRGCRKGFGRVEDNLPPIWTGGCPDMISCSPRLRQLNLKLVVLAVALALVGEDAVGHRARQPGLAAERPADRGAAPRRIGSGDPVSTFAGNAQHTAIFNPAARDLNAIHWSTSIDLNNTGVPAHYGAPLITAANTVLVPVKIAGDGFQIKAFDGTAGTAKYSLATDYILPPHDWIPAYQPALAGGPAGSRLYYPGAGGTVYFVDGPDHTPGAPVQRVFYTTLADYQARAAAFNASVFINTPITPDSEGNCYFGFRIVGTAPAPLSTTQGGFARITPDGAATYVLAGAAADDALIGRDSHNSAPALSNDQETLYVVVKSASSSDYAYLLGLDTTTLARKYRVFLKDPRNGQADKAVVLDESTSSATIAPDNDVYFGVLGSQSGGSQGFLLRFSGDLAVEKAPANFGWDSTAAIVPRDMVPSYTGASPYLIFSKYNNYANPAGGSENGVNRIGVFDPGSTQVNPRDPSSGVLVMREVLTMVGPTPDAEHSSIPTAVREWCINTAAVNPVTNSVFTPSEDGHLYRWNLATNSLSRAVRLTAGIGEPYVPTVIGPDGTVYTLNGGTLFALGGLSGVGVALSSSAPGDRTVVAGDPLAFIAAVTNTGAPGNTPTGTVTFQDTAYFVAGPDDLQSTTTVLASGVALDGTGHASCNTSALSAGSHFITAVYSGDGTFSAGSVVLVQRVHDHASSTTLASSLNPSGPGRAVTFTATVVSVPPGSGTPTGMVIFQEGPDALAQVPLDGGGAASFTTSALSPGAHTITAIYVSDPRFASSDASLTQAVGTATYSIPGFSDTAVVSGLSQPTAFTWTPDGRMLILEKAGRVRIVVDGVLQGTAALDISASVDSGVEKGLLGICLDPGFAINGHVYLYYTNLVPQNRISRFTMSGDTLVPGTESVILDHIDATNGNHNGGHVAIGPDGKLWTAPGDSGTGGAKSQNLAVGSFNGKVLRMELDGSPAAGNPFLADPTKEPRIWAYGFRNPWRFTFRPSNGSLYVSDVGQSTYEEIDVVTAGGNYGWPMAEGTLGGCAGCIAPAFEYDHTVGQAIIGGVFVTGGLYPAFLRGKYVFGDYVSSWIRYLEFSPGDAVVGGLQNFELRGGPGPVRNGSRSGDLLRGHQRREDLPHQSSARELLHGLSVPFDRHAQPCRAAGRAVAGGGRGSDVRPGGTVRHSPGANGGFLERNRDATDRRPGVSHVVSGRHGVAAGLDTQLQDWNHSCEQCDCSPGRGRGGDRALRAGRGDGGPGRGRQRVFSVGGCAASSDSRPPFSCDGKGGTPSGRGPPTACLISRKISNPCIDLRRLSAAGSVAASRIRPKKKSRRPGSPSRRRSIARWLAVSLSRPHLLHEFGEFDILDVLRIRLTVQVGMQIETAFRLDLGLLDRDPIRVREAVVPDSCDCPGNLRAGLPSGNPELIARDLLGDVEVGSGRADRCELVAEVAIERFEPVGKKNHGFHCRIEKDVSVVNIHHVGRFDEGVVQILVLGIQRMIDLESPSAFGESSGYVEIPSDIAATRPHEETDVIQCEDSPGA